LQHGALPLNGDVGRIADSLCFEHDLARETAITAVRQRAITLSAAAGRAVSWEETAGTLIDAFTACFALDLKPLALTAPERTLAETLHLERYGAQSWTFRR
jgi:lipoate-protein ligase A